MKNLFKAANQYVQESDWKTIAVLKFCLLALGITIGACIPEKHRKAVLQICIPVFLITYFPLMGKLVKILSDNIKRT